MSKKIVNKEAVFAAADGLKARGVRPTYDKLIEALGDGSNSTVRPHFDAWSQAENPPSRTVPEAVDTRAKIFIEAVWATALNETQSEIDIARNASNRKIEQAEHALSSSIQINLGLETERDGLLRNR